MTNSDLPAGDLPANTEQRDVVSREDQDALAAGSHHRAAAARDAGYFTEQITPVEVAGRKGTTGGRYGLVTMCIGGGQGIAAIFERL